MNKITKEHIKLELLKLVDAEKEGVSHSVVFKDLDEAIEHEVRKIYGRVNEYTELDQETIDFQAEDYDGYLDGAKPGDLVWGDDEVWVSQDTVESWLERSESRLDDKYSNSINDLADYLENRLIFDVLEKANNPVELK